MAGLRDVLIHQYFGVDYEIVWEVVVTLIKDVKIQLESLIKDLEHV